LLVCSFLLVSAVGASSIHGQVVSPLLRRTKIEIGPLPAGEVEIVMEMPTPPGWAAPAELTFWINGQGAAIGTVERTIPAVFTASETFDVGMDTSSPVADDDFDLAPFAFNGRLPRLHFMYF
jgi:arylsulfatase